MTNYNELRDQWFNVAKDMEAVANTFRADKTPIETSYALDSLGTELKVLANKIRESI